MPISIVCQSCGSRLNAPDNMAGRKAKCPRCRTVLTIQTAAPKSVSLPAPKERKLPKRRELEPKERITHLEEVPDETESEERITHLEEVPDETESEEEVVIAKVAKKPKRKKQRRRRDHSEPTEPAWLFWLFSVVGFVLVAGSIVFGAIYKGHGGLLLVYSVILAVMIPISTVILILSMFISSWLGGGIEFGEAHVVIPKAAVLLLVVNLIGLLPLGGFLAAPVWLFGLMLLFRLELWEARLLVFVNWGLNFLVRMAVFAAIMAAFAHEGLRSDLGQRLGQQAAILGEEVEAIHAIENLGGSCSTENEEDDGPIVVVTLAGTHATDADLVRLKSFPKLRWLDLSATLITDAGLIHLKKLNQLETLILTGTKVTNAGVADLQTALPRVRIVR
jgi:phage FluMu protein Com